MKQMLKLLAFTFLLCVRVSTQEGWFWQNPLPTGNDLLDIFVFDQNTAVAAGALGTVIKTVDGGTNWP